MILMPWIAPHVLPLGPRTEPDFLEGTQHFAELPAESLGVAAQCFLPRFLFAGLGEQAFIRLLQVLLVLKLSGFGSV